ncbi:alpha/beta fold hydrolase [Patulibacter sp.]|uniref:alpha/beta fold hydrolase n=1 Tax=Patulibacter sp. TaxID=1912859 RepID=UPI00272088DE|nr:alpha/beta fold hydrolase [Patulibacter sp.]MDO9408853.1 alpha/beta fold hydrolase [Patulibacter sp.]
MLAHDRHGEGPPLVLLHFLGGHRHVWGPLLPHLTRDRTVVTVDLPGFGDSRSLAGSPTLARLTDAVAGTIAELGLDRPAVAGLSLGGGIAIELARAGTVSSAVAVSPIGFATLPEMAFAKASIRATHAASRAIAGQVDRLAPQATLRAALGAQMFAKPWAVPPEDAAGLVRSMAHSPGTLPVLRAAMGQEVVAGGLLAPLTVAWGQRDALLLPRQGRRVVERLSYSRLVPLAGCGHIPLWDAPERVADVILDATAPR